VSEGVAVDEWFSTPVLAGSYVRLEPLARTHADGFFAAAPNDAEVFEHISIEPFRCRDDVESWIERVLAARAERIILPWTQIDAQTGEVAGTTSYYEVDPERRSVAIGYTWLGRRWWRTGLNTEAKLLLLRRAFEELGAVRVVWHTTYVTSGRRRLSPDSAHNVKGSCASTSGDGTDRGGTPCSTP